MVVIVILLAVAVIGLMLGGFAGIVLALAAAFGILMASIWLYLR